MTTNVCKNPECSSRQDILTKHADMLIGDDGYCLNCRALLDAPKVVYVSAYGKTGRVIVDRQPFKGIDAGMSYVMTEIVEPRREWPAVLGRFSMTVDYDERGREEFWQWKRPSDEYVSRCLVMHNPDVYTVQIEAGARYEEDVA